jgi:hypothetical protein
MLRIKSFWQVCCKKINFSKNAQNQKVEEMLPGFPLCMFAPFPKGWGKLWLNPIFVKTILPARCRAQPFSKHVVGSLQNPVI